MRKTLLALLICTMSFNSMLGVANAAPKKKASDKEPVFKVLPKSERKPLVINRSCDERRSSCPTVNSNAYIQSINFCRITDQTADWKVSLGFPRYPDAILGNAKVDVLVMVYEFADKKFPPSAYPILQKEAKQTEELYKRISNGAIDLNFVFPKIEDWVRFPKNNSEYIPQLLSGDEIINLVLDQGAYLNPDTYEAVYIHSPNDLENANANGTRNLPYQSLGRSVPRVYFTSGNWMGFGGYSHGLGHLLFFFEDIYDRSKSGRDFHPAGLWDLMGAGGAFFAWHMYLNGWLTDNQVDCLPPSFKSSTHLLTPISTLLGKKLIAIAGDPGKLLLIEYRTGRVDEDLLSDGVCNTGGCTGDRQEGLVIYFVDTTINHLLGPITVPEKYYSRTMVIGEKISYRGYVIEFLAKGRKGAYVRVKNA